jgi:plastocyanin
MTNWLALLCACLALGLGAAGCGDDDEDEGGGGGGAQTQEQPTDTGAKPKSQTVAMKNTQFDPKAISVSKGATVKWANEDSVGHDVTKVGGAGADFKSGEAGGLGQGDTFEQTFDTAGEVKYECTVHPGMEGTVTVK